MPQATAINANVLAAQAVLALDASKYEPELEPWVVDLFGAETFVVPGASTAVSHPVARR